MNKLAIVVAAAAMVLALAGCASNAASGAASSASSSSARAASVGLANPWTKVATAEEAAKGAGLDGFTVPAEVVIGDVTAKDPAFSCMEGIAQADYSAGAVGFTVRKGKGVSGQAFTGDYNNYAETWVQDVYGTEVECSGKEKGVANLATWQANGFVYALYCIGLSGEDFGIPEAGLADIVVSVK